MKAFDFIKWIFEADIRLKNAISVSLALIATALFFILSNKIEWYHSIVEYGAIAVAISLAVTFTVIFLFVNCICTLAMRVLESRDARLDFIVREFEQRKSIYDTLNSLTQTQRNFVLQRLREGSPQVAAWEIGGHQAVWGPDVDVLERKGIVIKLTYDNFEISSDYWEYLLENYDQDNSKLNLDPPLKK